MKKAFKRNLDVTVNLNEFTGENEKFDLFAYVFSKSGRLIGKKKVMPDENQPCIAKADFDLTLKDENVIVKLGPDVEVPSDLGRHAPVVEGTVLKEGKSALTFDIGKQLWCPWLRKPYYVRGNVVKHTDAEELAIPYGEVDIYDVDIGFFYRLRDDIIERIREGLLDVITNPPPVVRPPKADEVFKPSWWKDDYCGTPIGPRPPIGKNPDINKILAELPREWSFARERFAGLSGVRAKINKTIESMIPEEKMKWLESEALENVKMSSLIYTNTMQFRKLLVEKFQSFRFWLCWFPWIYWLWSPHFWCSLEKLGTARIQQDGSFSRLIWLSARRRDIPDLWFRIRQQVNGVERIIFARYPVPCNTYWNHPNSQPVRLIVTDSQAVAYHKEHDISDNDGLWVCPLAIGNYSLKRIYGTGGGNVPITNSDPRIGKYESIGTGLNGTLDTFREGPFGGTIGLRILFSSELLDNNVKFYKIKYRLNGSGSWSDANNDVQRHYSHYNSANKSLEFVPYHLGPQSKGSVSNLFEIRPKFPPNKGAEPYADWYVLNSKVDLMSGYIDTTPISNGCLEIKLELYDANGTRINPPAYNGGIQFRLPASADSWEIIETEAAVDVNPDLVKPDPENNSYQAFIFRLQIDNNATTAEIQAPELASTVDTISDCGIIHYSNSDTNLKLTYQARQQNRYAMYSFNVIRNITPVISITGQAGDMGPGGSFTITPQIRRSAASAPNSYLLDCCPDAAFSMNLYVWNMAFDGWQRIAKDDSAVRAFALVPKTE